MGQTKRRLVNHNVLTKMYMHLKEINQMKVALLIQELTIKENENEVEEE